MAISSTDTSPVRASSSSTKLKQKNLMHFKGKKKLGPTNTRLKRPTSVKLKAKKTLQDGVNGARKQATADKRKLKQIHSQADMNSPAMLRAIDVQSKLPSKYPSFVKFMLKSHVYRGFWLGLPRSFCDEHMPMQDETFLLVDEDVEKEEEKHWATYLAKKSGLSGGWRGFSIAHKLVAGDVVVFQLIESRKFKVYIVRTRERADMDGAIGHFDLNSQAETSADYIPLGDDVKNVIDSEPASTAQASGDSLDSEPPATSQETGNDFDYDPEASLQETGNGSDFETVATLQQTEKSDDVECIGLSKSDSEVKGFDSFNVIIDGLNINSEIPDHLRYRYYELCCNQKNILHDDLVKGLNFKLAAGIISETAIMADSIKAAELTSSLELLQSWDKTLKAFEGMGMRVGFLCTRLNKLTCLLHEQEIIRSKKLEQTLLEVEIRDLEGKLSKRGEVRKTLDAEIEGLLVKGSGAETLFKNIVLEFM